MTRQWRRFVDWLLGERCSCDARVLPRDVAEHEASGHAKACGRRLRTVAPVPGPRGRCGALLPLPTPNQQFVTSTSCALPHGHRGWHRADDGAEWTR